MGRMERTIDKLIVFAICLAGLALGGWGGTVPLSEGTAGAVCVSTALVAVCAGALAEALPDRIRPAAPVLLCATALVSPCGAAFLPLACYDAMRELHRGGFGHAVAAAPGAALAASLALWSPNVAAAALTAASCAAGALLSARTNRLLARLDTLHRLRDDMTVRTWDLLDRNRDLEERLVRADGGGPGGAGDGCPSDEGIPARPAGFSCLSDREFEVARLIAEGLDNREIAAAAYLSEGTVRNHISSILTKLQLKNRTQIAIAFWRG